jgi:hypothetical protein
MPNADLFHLNWFLTRSDYLQLGEPEPLNKNYLTLKKRF